MAENKTRPTRQSVASFLRALPEERRADCRILADMMKELTGADGRMWGSAIVGFGDYHYKYASGREGDWFLTGFSPRKNDLTVYVMAGLDGYAEQLARLGKHKAGKSCLYLKRLADIDLGVLRAILADSIIRPMGG
ncbi:MAG: DUF1801 domain-containing protein [Acidobacteria bacterium]|nr:DUF1801 domain-containing protein [Acidobacteriota bacterium]